MRYTDDILYILGTAAVVSAAYFINYILGTAVLGVSLLVSAYLAARYGGGGR